MTQQDFLENLRDAKAAHVKWHAQAVAMTMGYETGEESVPKLYNNCTFGKWYYGVGQFISNFPGFKEIEPLHMDLHNIYIEIYQKYIEPTKKSFFINRKKEDKKKQEELEVLTNKLKDISKELIQKIENLESSILRLSTNEFVNSYITPRQIK